MKVLLFNGSPNQNGNTDAILKSIANGAKSEGAETKIVDTNKLKMKGCQGCYGCQRTDSNGECVILDDMKPLFNEIYKADAIVIGSPIYMGQMTSQTKQIFDRFFAFMKPNFSSHLTNKKAALVFTHGQADQNLYKPYVDQTTGTLKMMGFNVVESMIANGMYKPDMAVKNNEIMEKSKQIGKSIVKEV